LSHDEATVCYENNKEYEMALYFRTSRASMEEAQSAVVVGYSCYQYWPLVAALPSQGTIAESEFEDRRCSAGLDLWTLTGARRFH
jgi:hypothetical protein